MKQTMKQQRFFISLLFLLMISITFFSICRLRIIHTGNYKRATADLKEFSPSEVYMLDGEWEFYPNRKVVRVFDPNNFIQVPSTWENYHTPLISIEKNACATYHFSLSLPSPGQYALYIGKISSAYELYINGSLLASSGRVGTSKDTEVSLYKKQVIPFYSYNSHIDIVVYVSNYHHHTGGIRTSIYFGTINSISRYQALMLINNALYCGAFLVTIFFTLLFDYSSQRTKSAIYLALFSYSMLLFQAIMDGSIASYLFDSVSSVHIMRFQFAVYILQTLSLLLYLVSFFSLKKLRKLLWIIIGVDAVYVSLLCFAKNYFMFTYNLIPLLMLYLHGIYLLVVLIYIVIKKLPYYRLMIISLIPLLFGTYVEVQITTENNYYYLFTNNNFMVLGALIFILLQSYIIASYIRTAVIASEQAANMEIAFLQAQISPHFFFNVLNNIYYLLDTNLPLAKNLLIDFNTYLRAKYKFDYRKKIYYHLSEEIELIRAFVEIERVRLHGQITLVVDIDERLQSLLIPPMLLQPLIENSIKHGYTSQMLTIHVQIIHNNNYAYFLIEDDGKGMGIDLIAQITQSNPEKFGIGIKNVNYRLKICYNEKLSFQSTLGEGTAVSFKIPLEV